ncbi:hypothetical protein TA3x_004454 [Tundrisphaera sp. TA3]|uniref:hypothetical protein n=1 Tax=Tundrisphaera sp. TA3 TaxID=3435775 RepID=UPI003EC0BDF0
MEAIPSPSPDSLPAPAETPEAILDELRDARDLSDEEREARLARLVEQFPADRLRVAARSRLADLGGGDAEAVLRLVEAFATPALLEDLADALLGQPGLPPERSWEALALLEGAGLLVDYPELAERLDELNETIDADGSLEDLSDHLDDEPEGSWVALQALGAVEPEVAEEIVAGLADAPGGPGLVSFLRILAFAHEPRIRHAAISALAARPDDDDDHRAAWAEIAHDHPDPSIRERAARRLGPDAGAEVARALARPERARPHRTGCLVTALDGAGRGSIVLTATDRGRAVAATFLCDVWRGVVEVIGEVGDRPDLASGFLDLFAESETRDLVEGMPGLADGLLAGSLLLCDRTTTPALRYWLERTVGPEFVPRPFPGLVGDEDLADHALDSMADTARMILDACPDWVDASALTYDIAEEIALRSGESPPDPYRDAGAYRYLFEHHLKDRLEHYRRMLLWMASFWEASGSHDLGRSALALSWQLADPQHAVPAHPFTMDLSTRSLAAAQAHLRAGHDPRRG